MTGRQLVTADTVARFIGVERETVWRWSRQQKIPTVRIGQRLRFDQEAVAASLGLSRPTPPPSDLPPAA